MRYSIPAAFVAFVASAVAQTPGFDALSTPAQGESVAAGSTYTVVWAVSSYADQTVSLSLLGGESSTTLQDLGVFASGVTNGAGSYAWPVDASLGTAATYGIKISLESDPSIFQYSFPFQIAAAAAVSSNENVVSTTAAASSSAEGYATTVISSSSSAAIETYSAEAASTSCESSTIVETTHAASTVATSSSVAAYPTTTFAATTSAAYGNYSTSTLASHTKTASAGNSTATSTPVAAGAARSLAGGLALVGSLALAAVFAL